MEHLQGTYSLPLVLLSFIIAVFTSYCAVELCCRLWQVQARMKAVRIALGSLTLGLGFWSMHFVGLLALRLPIEVRYNAPYIFISMLLPVAAVLAGLSVLTDGHPSRIKLAAAGVFMTLAVCGMHYVGMTSMIMPAEIRYDPVIVLVSCVFAGGVSFASIYLLQRRRGRGKGPPGLRARIASSLLFGALLAAMHYTGMSAASYEAYPAAPLLPDPDAGFSEVVLATCVGAASLLLVLVVSGGQMMDRRFALRLAEQSRQRYDSIFEHNPDMVCLFDLKGQLLRVNPAAERITGYNREMFLSRSFTSLLNRRDAARVRACFARVLEGTPQTIECTLRHRSGRKIHLSTTIVPMVAGGRIVDIYTISKDITEQKESERLLVQAKMEAERAARVNSEFLAVMSHEIRTPLNGILAMSDLLLESDLEGEPREYAKIINRSGTALLSVIGDVLDFSKMEYGTVSLKREAFSLHACMEESLGLFAPQTQQRELELRCEWDERLPAQLFGDEGRLRQVLINLIGNAVKFTERGEIRVSVRERRREGERVELEFAVRDTGTGIPEEALPNLFQPFYQHASSAKKHGGTGLGLAISKRIVELMGGTIRVESVPGEGAEFLFTVQMQTASAPAAVELGRSG
ncbi:PAS/PAC sensor hybrid histidine kinase [Paenibacillus mucilaginosus 3016]|uniref:Circadian input-output histidine kinase CikA n=2 Tax=Paenibacillus mucilaginosus TaxID=61624 RepID=H6NKL3_9BACL|nr:MHYT domain-containing protein [Paenibacillus mucilaginosus]AFC33150.1 PAS/PAC sensor hybrid histidine kinase [Paenibacillus mucilaginosus 3016]AFH65464.1 histidine kinase [Paenibacillus mucilaginosus K02]WFA21581.1 PAS domain S-box protein [Paenibacillus mucilaginosus]